MSYFESPLHFHTLCLRNFSQHFQTYLRELPSDDETFFQCDFCGEDIDGSTSIHCCEICRFYVHTSCATPPRQIQHSRHEHKLDLRVPDEWSNNGEYRCVKFDSGCRFKIHAGTAIETLWAGKYYCSMLREAGDEESRLKFAHKHPLTSFPARTGIHCGGCEMQISEEAFGCSKCNFFLHKSCAKAPLEIQSHPFHPEHPLNLFWNASDMGECRACDLELSIGYCCKKCHLFFDLFCVTSTMPCEDDVREDIRRGPSVIDHPLHVHQLSSYHSKTDTMFECRICKDHIPSGYFLGCPYCSFFLHESCAQPPKEIKHYLHPEHTLTSGQCSSDYEHICLSCEYPVRREPYCYTCQKCDFFIHKTCASATLSHLEKGVGTTVEFSFHEHELKLYYSDDLDNCTVCDRTISKKSPAYKCHSQDCSFMLHKSCAQLPSNLVHSSHLLHPLTLSFKPPYRHITCGRCDKGISGLFAFSCGECNFYLHVACAQIPTTLKHPFHKHDLFYFADAHENLECSACKKSCSIDLFRCVQCKFNLHYDCSRLLQTIKSKHHIDPLVLRESFIEDDSGKYYCDICEKRRDPNKWVYFCETDNCEYVAHVECALSPVKLKVIEEDDFILRKEDIQRRQKEIKVSQEEVTAKEVSLRPLMMELESMRAKLESQRVQLEEVRTEHAKWINVEVITGYQSAREEEDLDPAYAELQTPGARLEELETEQAN